jgi:hypothetical protein
VSADRLDDVCGALRRWAEHLRRVAVVQRERDAVRAAVDYCRRIEAIEHALRDASQEERDLMAVQLSARSLAVYAALLPPGRAAVGLEPERP